MMDKRPVGLTKDAGYQIGVRRTFAASREGLWEFLLSPEGMGLWLGGRAELEPKKGSRYTADNGTSGEVRAAKLHEQLRLTWQPEGWSQSSTLQLRLLPAANGRTTVSFHQERLVDSAVREQMKERWEKALQELAQWSAGTGREEGSGL